MLAQVICDLCISEVVCVVKVLLQLSVGCGGFLGFFEVVCGLWRFLRLYRFFEVVCGLWRFLRLYRFSRLSVGCGGFHSKSCGCREYNLTIYLHSL